MTAATSASPTIGASAPSPASASRSSSRSMCVLICAASSYSSASTAACFSAASRSRSACSAASVVAAAAAQPHLGGGLVDQVDGLVGQAVLGDVAVAQPGGGEQRLVGDLAAVVLLVGRAQPAQDLDGLVDRRLLDGHGREAARQRAVALDLAELGQRGGADHPQLAAGEHRLEHVGGVHRALGVAGAEDRVELVDEQDHAALGLGDLGEGGLQPLLELAAVLRAGDHAGEVERHEARAAQRLGHVVLRDAQREALDDRGLADAGLADQHGVVLAPAGEDLDGLLDLGGAADHGIDPAGAPRRRSGRGRTRRARGSWTAAAGALGAGRGHAALGGHELARAGLADHGRATLAPSEATTRIVPGRSPQTAQVPPATASGKSVKGFKTVAPSQKISVDSTKISFATAHEVCRPVT